VSWTNGQQADRGVFITTSRFSAEAGSYVERIPNPIVLIDGRRLAELMILYNQRRLSVMW